MLIHQCRTHLRQLFHGSSTMSRCSGREHNLRRSHTFRNHRLLRDVMIVEMYGTTLLVRFATTTTKLAWTRGPRSELHLNGLAMACFRHRRFPDHLQLGKSLRLDNSTPPGLDWPTSARGKSVTEKSCWHFAKISLDKFSRLLVRPRDITTCCTAQETSVKAIVVSRLLRTLSTLRRWEICQ
jgi:hypothetical protein